LEQFVAKRYLSSLSLPLSLSLPDFHVATQFVVVVAAAIVILVGATLFKKAYGPSFQIGLG